MNLFSELYIFYGSIFIFFIILYLDNKVIKVNPLPLYIRKNYSLEYMNSSGGFEKYGFDDILEKLDELGYKGLHECEFNYNYVKDGIRNNPVKFIGQYCNNGLRQNIQIVFKSKQDHRMIHELVKKVIETTSKESMERNEEFNDNFMSNGSYNAITSRSRSGIPTRYG